MLTPIHLALGEPRDIPVSYSMLEDAVEAGVPESDALDWKRALPGESGLGTTDFPKDVAAMANSGGGIIVFGVEESEKKATALVDVGLLSERHERALRSVAVSAIHPPVFNLSVLRLGIEGDQAVAVVVPASVDGPHMIYRGEYFGAPIRNDADTVWMREPAVARAYRARFDDQRRHDVALGELYSDTAARRVPQRAWFVGVAVPRRAQVPHRERFPNPRVLVGDAMGISDAYLRARDHRDRPTGRGNSVLGEVDQYNLRPGLQRWVAVPSKPGTVYEAWGSFHNDGAVTLACSLGGQRMSAGGVFDATHFLSKDLEAAVADLMSMVRVVGSSEIDAEYDVRIGVEWDRAEPLLIWTQDNSGHPYDGKSTPLPRFVPVTRTVVANDSVEGFVSQVVELGRDCVNQGGLTYLQHLPDSRTTSGARG